MKRFFLACVVMLASVSPLHGQAITRLANQSASGNLVTNGDTVSLPVPAGVGFGSVGVEARGTWTGTIEIQCAASTGGGSFVALTLVPRNSTTPVTSFTANGQWSASIAGCQRVQAAATATMTGTATVTLVGTFTAYPSISAVNGAGTFPIGSGTGTAAVSGVITSSITPAQTGANTNETTLWTYTLPGNSLTTNGQAVRLTVCGLNAANGNAKTLTVYFGATTILIANANTTSAAAWCSSFVILRTSATGQFFQRVYSTYGGTVASASLATAVETLSGDVVIKVTGTNGSASAGDIVLNWALLEWL